VRYYINKYFEKENIVGMPSAIRTYHYIYGDNGVVALYLENSNPYFSPAGDSIYYIHTDHLGSYCAITSPSKQVVIRNHFDPWGNYVVRHFTPVFPNVSFIQRGFTGHQHYPELKIINMNGRLYDPVIGRFFSPDNFVQLSEFSQSYNRYTYCLNNPLNYTDPNGDLFIGSRFWDEYFERIEKDLDDWVRNNETGEYVWMDNVTKPEDTPKGYTYVGPNNNDILTDLNIFAQTQRQEVVRKGGGATADELIRSAPIAAKASVTGILDVEAMVSYNPANRSANNVLGRTFDGVRFEGTVISVTASSNTDAALNYGGSLAVTANGKTSYDVLGTPSTAYIIPAGSIMKSASLMYPANSITSTTSFQRATISAGAANPNLQIHPNSINMNFNLMLYPTTRRP
jgi:RHS repeat-associated protein